MMSSKIGIEPVIPETRCNDLMDLALVDSIILMLSLCTRTEMYIGDFDLLSEKELERTVFSMRNTK